MEKNYTTGLRAIFKTGLFMLTLFLGRAEMLNAQALSYTSFSGYASCNINSVSGTGYVSTGLANGWDSYTSNTGTVYPWAGDMGWCTSQGTGVAIPGHTTPAAGVTYTFGASPNFSGCGQYFLLDLNNLNIATGSSNSIGYTLNGSFSTGTSLSSTATASANVLTITGTTQTAFINTSGNQSSTLTPNIKIVITTGSTSNWAQNPSNSKQWYVIPNSGVSSFTVNIQALMDVSIYNSQNPMTLAAGYSDATISGCPYDACQNSISNTTYASGTYYGAGWVLYGIHCVPGATWGVPQAVFNPSFVAGPSAPVIGTITQPLCNNGTGSVALSGLPSSGTWTITGSPSGSWSGTGSTYTVTGLTAGTTYSFVVTNSSGWKSCTSATAAITNPSVPSTPVIGYTNPTCHSGTGTVTVTTATTGGTGAITYSLNGGTKQSATTWTGLAAGSYTVVGYDANNCNSATSNSVTITIPSAVTTPVIGVTNPNCSTGTATVTVTTPSTGGTGTIKYSLNGGAQQTSTTFSGISTNGSYTVVAYDANGCNSATSNSVTVAIPSALTTPVIGVTNPSCNSGTATITVTTPTTGGTGTIKYSLNGGAQQTSTTFSGISTNGSYTVVAYDANSCNSATSNSVTVAIPTALTTPVIGVTNPSCNSGTATITVTTPTTGGTGTIKYSLNGGAQQTSTTFSGISTNGGYTVVSYDANSCNSATSNSVTVAIPTALTTPVIGVTNPSCNSGTATITVTTPTTGGTGTIKYSLNGGAQQTSTTFSGISTNGGYTVVAYDANSCNSATSNSVTVAIPTAVTTPVIGVTNPSCNSGTATITVTTPSTGGTGTIQYSLNGGAHQTSTTFSGISTNGSYTVVAYDANSCNSATSNSVTVAIPTALTTPVIGVTNPSCNSGTATITVTTPTTGGTGTIKYSLNGGAQQTSTTFSGISTNGSYTVVAYDANSCNSATSNSVTVAIPTALTTPVIGVTNPACHSGTATITVTTPTTGGTGTIKYSLNGGAQQTSTTFSGISTNGSYTVVAYDANSCNSATSNSVTVAIPTALTTPAITGTNVLCNGGSSGAITVTTPTTGGTGTIKYSLNGGAQQTSTSFTGLTVAGGPYTVVAYDANGCSSTTSNSVTLTQPSVLTASISPVTPVTCISTGITLTATPAGGATPYGTSAWTGAGSGSLSSTSITNPTFSNGSAGSYALTYTITDHNSCTATATTSVTVDPNVTIGTVAASSSLTQNICSSTTPAGTFNVTSVSGGSGNFEYKWYQYNSATASAPMGTNPVQTGWTAVTSGTNYDVSSTASPSPNFSPIATATSVTYACYVSPVGAPACSGVGQWANGQVNITVSAPAAFITGGNVTVCTGASVVLNATTPITVTPLTWQWYACTAANLANMTSSAPPPGGPTGAYALSGATSPSYTVLTTSTSNLYFLACASYAGGACSPANSATQYVVVNAQPSITGTTPGAVCTTGTASLGATITGGVSPAYQWSYSSSPVSNGTPTGITYTTGTTNPMNVSVSSGASPATLTYQISVTDAGSGCTATPVTNVNLVINAQPQLTNLTNVNICTGLAGTATFTSTASGGVGNATGFTWQYSPNGTTWTTITNATTGLPTGATYSITTTGGGETSNLTITTTSSIAAATYYYQCIATFTGSGCATTITSNTGNLIVNPAPVIVTQPGTLNICVGGTGAFPVNITGGYSPTYQWQYNSGLYTNVADGTPTGLTYSGTGNSEDLTVNVGGTAGPGSKFYKLITSYTASGCPSTLSGLTIGTLIIYADPTIGTQPAASTTICAGASPGLSISATGGDVLSYQWQYKNGGVWVNVVNGTPAGFSYTGATTNSLGITTAGSTAAGTYDFQCIVSSTGTCNPVTSNTAVIVVNASPTSITPTVDVNPICITTGAANIQVAGSEIGANYQLQNVVGPTNVGSAVAGTGGTINLPTGSITANTTYQVLATYVSGGCSTVTPTTTTVVAVSPSLSIGSQIGSNHYTFGTIGTPTIPTGWTNPNNSNAVSWMTGTANPATSGSYSYINSTAGLSTASTGAYIQTPTGGSSNTPNVDLITSSISTLGYTNISVQWGARKTSDYTGSVSLYYSIDGGTTWTSVAFTDAQANVTGTPWSLVNNTVQVLLPSAANNQSSLMLKWSANPSTDASYYSMNDIGIYGLGTIVNCAGSSINLPFLNTSCSMTKYSVANDVSNPWPSATPFVPVTNATLPSSPISIAVPAATATGTYNLDITLNDGSGNNSNTISFPVTTSPAITLTPVLNNCSMNNNVQALGSFGYSDVVVVYANGGSGAYNFTAGTTVDTLVSIIDETGTDYAATTNHSGVKGVYLAKADAGPHTFTVTDASANCQTTTTVVTQSGGPTTVPFNNATGVPIGAGGTFGGGNGIWGAFSSTGQSDPLVPTSPVNFVNGPALGCIQTPEFGSNWVVYQVNSLSGLPAPGGDTTNNSAVVEINNNGQNLDSVSVSVYRDATLPETPNAATQTTACWTYPEYALERHFMIKSTKSTVANSFSSSVGVRLYFTDAEFQDLKYWTNYIAAHATGSSAGCAFGDTTTSLYSLYVTKYSYVGGGTNNEDGNYGNNTLGASGIYRLFGSNTSNTGNGPVAHPIDASGAQLATGGSTNLHYLQMDVREFGEFWLSGSQAIEALPIAMIYFEAVAMNNDSIQIRWATASEVNCASFNIERSTDGTNWSTIGTVAGHNNSVVEQDYVFNDLNVTPDVVYYYRLKQNDNNGNFTYTDVVQAMINASGSFLVSNFVPNPSSSKTQLTITTSSAQEITVDFYDMIGQKVMTANETLVAGNNTIDFDIRRFAAGTYSVVVTAAGQLYAKKIVITR